jgi:hypothetical protein
VSLLFICLLFPALIGVFYLFDSLARIEFERHRRDWVEDGRPSGFFWTPEEDDGSGRRISRTGGRFTRTACAFSWAFATPEWLEGEPEGKYTLFWFRLLFFIWHAGIIALVIVESKGSR